MSDDGTLFLDQECTLILLIASFLIEINAKYAKLIKIDKVKIWVSVAAARLSLAKLHELSQEKRS